jgi:S-formylglutathione hydrolase FrmB
LNKITYYLTFIIKVIMAFNTTATIASFGGKLLKLTHKATSTNCEMALNLYLPPQATKQGSKVPVLFYLSGLTCTGDNCAEKGFFQHGASQKGIAVVYPDTSPSAHHSIWYFHVWLIKLM